MIIMTSIVMLNNNYIKIFTIFTKSSSIKPLPAVDRSALRGRGFLEGPWFWGALAGGRVVAATGGVPGGLEQAVYGGDDVTQGAVLNSVSPFPGCPAFGTAVPLQYGACDIPKFIFNDVCVVHTTLFFVVPAEWTVRDFGSKHLIWDFGNKKCPTMGACL